MSDDKFDNPFPGRAIVEMPDGTRREIPITAREMGGVRDFSYSWTCPDCKAQVSGTARDMGDLIPCHKCENAAEDR